MLPGAGSQRPLGASGGSQRPSVVMVPVRGVEVGRGVRVGSGSLDVRVGGTRVITAAVCVSDGQSSVARGVGVYVAVDVTVAVRVLVGVAVRVGVLLGVKLG